MDEDSNKDKGDLACEVCNVEDEEISQEGTQVKPLRTPSAPFRQEMPEHSLTHFPFWKWCTVCVMGKPKVSKHSTTGGTEESAVPIV